jgi:hypothetical protein
MKKFRYLSHDQRNFLRAIRDEAVTLDCLARRMNLTPQRLSRWFRSELFREAQAEVVEELRRRRELEFELAKQQATRTLSRISSGGSGTALELRASIDVLKIDSSRRRSKRKAIKSKPDAEPSRSLIHPDVDPAEAQRLMDAMSDPANPA